MITYMIVITQAENPTQTIKSYPIYDKDTIKEDFIYLKSFIQKKFPASFVELVEVK